MESYEFEYDKKTQTQIEIEIETTVGFVQMNWALAVVDAPRPKTAATSHQPRRSDVHLAEKSWKVKKKGIFPL